MKKILCAVIAALLMLSFCSCGGKKTGPVVSASPKDNTPTSKRFFQKSKGIDAEVYVPQMKDNKKVNDLIDKTAKDFVSENYGVNDLSLEDKGTEKSPSVTLVLNYRVMLQNDDYFSAMFSGTASGVPNAPTRFTFGIVIDLKTEKLADIEKLYKVSEHQKDILDNKESYLTGGYSPSEFDGGKLSQGLSNNPTYYMTQLKLGLVLRSSYDYITLEIPLDDLG